MADSEKEKPRSKKGIVIFLAAVFVLGLLAFAGYRIYRYINDPYTGFAAVYTEEVIGGDGVRFMPYLEGYIRVSKDGAEAVDSDGLRLWNMSYVMNNPEIVVCGKCASVADIGGYVAVVTDGAGNVSRVEMPYKIEEIECSEVGVTAIRMNDESSDYIRLVDIAGEKIAEIKTVEAKDGFPVDMALSYDAKKLLTSYLVIDGENSRGWLTFYNFGNVGQDFTNNITGIFKYDEVVPVVNFLGKNSACAFFDDEIRFFTVSEVPSEGKRVGFEEYIIAANASDKGVVVMENSKESGITSVTKAYDTAGNLVFESKSSNELTGAMYYGKNLLFYNEYACQILDKSGKVIFNGNFGGLAINSIMPSNGKDRLLLFENGKVTTIRLTKDNKVE